MQSLCHNSEKATMTRHNSKGRVKNWMNIYFIGAWRIPMTWTIVKMRFSRRCIGNRVLSLSGFLSPINGINSFWRIVSHYHSQSSLKISDDSKTLYCSSSSSRAQQWQVHQKLHLFKNSQGNHNFLLSSHTKTWLLISIHASMTTIC